MSNNRVHKSIQPPPSSFQEIRLSRKIMSIHYYKKHVCRVLPASLFGGIRGICRKGYRLIRASYNLSSAQDPIFVGGENIPREIGITSYNLGSTSGTSKSIIDVFKSHKPLHFITLLNINIICVQ